MESGMLNFGQSHAFQEITAAQLRDMLAQGHALVVDVREADEFAAGHIPGALNMPLSAFQPGQVPQHEGKVVVLNCLGGKRSGMALGKCATARTAVDTHLAGGFGAWTQAGFPIEC
jgi:rhodanese-related sulfurtransferase